MTVARFVAATLFLSVAAGLALWVGGYGAGTALLGALAVLVALQVVYFAYLMLKAKAPSRNPDDGPADP